MKINIFVLTFCSFVSTIWAQDYELVYSGPPGAVMVDSFKTSIGDTLEFQFCTESVPDKLVVYMDDTLSFYIGNNVGTNKNISQYHGYCEFVYDDSLVILMTDGVPPDNFFCQGKNGGKMTLKLISNRCWVKFKVSGNTEMATVYEIRIFHIKRMPLVTIEMNYCYDRVEFDSIINCELVGIIPINVNDLWYHLSRPTCEQNGSVIFPEHPEFNKYDLSFGITELIVFNEFCTDTIRFEFIDVCRLYIPNAFSPNNDGVNDIFIVYSDFPLYHVQIFDRWGNLIYSNTHNSNIDGWDGGDYQAGVYTYIITIDGIIFAGDITIVI